MVHIVKRTFFAELCPIGLSDSQSNNYDNKAICTERIEKVIL